MMMSLTQNSWKKPVTKIPDGVKCRGHRWTADLGFAVLWSRTTLAGPKQSQWLALPNSAAASYLENNF